MAIEKIKNFGTQSQSSLLESCKMILLDSFTENNQNYQPEFFITFLDTIAAPVFYKDTSGKYLGCNKAYERFLGKTRGEIIGKTVYDIGQNELAEKYETMDRELFERPGKQIYESKVKLADGSERNVIFHKAAFSDPSGKTAGIIGFIQDVTELIRAIDALREGGQDIKAILNTSTDSIILIDTSGIVLEANETITHRLRVDIETLKGKDLFSFLSPETSEYRRKVVDKVIVEGKPFHFEDERDGLSILNSIYPVFGKNEQVEKLAIFGMDFTFIETAADSLRRNKAIYQLTVETAIDGYAHLDLNGRILEVNEAYCTISGYTREELLRMHISDLEASENYEQTVAHICKVIELGKDRFETKHFAKNGRILDIEISTTYSEKAGPGFFCFFRDITKQKLMGETLRESEARFHSYIEQAPDGIFVADEKGNYIEVNEAASKITGYSKEELLKMNLSGIVFPEDNKKALFHFRNTVETGKAVDDVQLLTKDREKRICTVKAVKLNEQRVLGFVHDITERRIIENEREIIIHLLSLLNASNDLPELIESVTELLKNWSGCEAVGIRLKEGDDYPYYQTQGFPASFVKLENCLCSRDIDGLILRDEWGNPVLECMCGNIIYGHFDPNMPFFTKHGSFWTNSTSELLASTSESDRQARTRNRCNGEGYESVALIPLRSQGETLGLIQLNDSRKGIFTAESIALFERLCDSVALALAQRQAQETIKQNKNKLESIFRAAPVGIGVVTNRILTDVNAHISEMTGYSYNELIGYNARMLYLTQEDFDYVGKEKYKQIAEKGTGSVETRWRRKDGSVIDVLLSSTPIDTSDLSKGVTFTALDITERKKAEMALAEEAVRRRILVEQSIDGIVILDMNGKVCEANHRYAQMLGYSQEEVNELHVWDWDTQWSREHLLEMIAEVDENGEHFETQQRRKDGTLIDVDISSNAAFFGAQKFIFCVCRDISERKKAEKELIESESILNEVQSIAGIGSFFWDLLDDSLKYSRNMFSLAGLSADTFSGKMDSSITDLVHPGDRSFVEQEIREMIKQRRTWPMEFRIVRPDGKERIWQSLSRFVLDEKGIPIQCIGIHEDITEKRESEEKLQILASLMETSPASITVHDFEGNILHVNPTTYKLHGYSQNEMSPFNLQFLDDPETARKVPQRMQEIMEKGNASFEVSHIRKDGTKFPLHVNAKRVLWKGKDAVLSIALDISKSKLAEEERRAANERLMLATRAGGVGIWDYDVVNNKIVWDDQMFCLYGIKPGRFGAAYEAWKTGIHPEDLSRSDKEVQMALRGEKEFNTEFRVVWPDGTIRNIRALATVQRDHTGLPLRMIGTNWDITDQKRTELALKESEKKFRNYIDSSPIGIAVVNGKGKHIDVNHAVSCITGYTEEELLSMNIIDLLSSPEKKLIQEYLSVLSVNDTFSTKFKILRKDNAIIYCQTYAVKLSEDSYLAFISDITDQERACEQVHLNEIRLQNLVNIFQYDSNSVQDLLDYALEKAINLTESKIGYIYHYEEDEQHFILNTWSKGVMKECAITEPQTVYELEHTGLWGEAVRQRKPLIVNDYPAHNLFKKGYPEGHVELYKYMTIPIFERNKIVAVIGVANKESDYTYTDFLQLSLLMDSVWKIVKQKEIEEELKKREKLLSKIFEILPVGVWVADKEGRLLSGNPMGVKIWGAEPHVSIEQYGVFKALRLPSGEKIAPDDWALAHTIKEGVTIVNEMLEIETFDGKKKKILNYTAPVQDEQGNIQGAIVVNQDITSLIQVEENLIEANERLALSMEASYTGFWDMNLDSKDMYLSDQMYTMLGYKPEEGPKNMESFFDIVHPDDKEIVINTFSESTSQLKLIHIDLRLRCKSGEWLWVSVKGKPISLDGSGKPHRLIGTQADITSRIKAEEALLYAKAAADESNRIKSEFLKNVTHELRTPLTSVIGFSDVILEQESSNLNDSQKRYIQHINKGGRNLLETINKILEFSKYESGEMEHLSLEKVSVKQVINETISILLSQSIKKDQTIEVQISSDVPEIYLDKHKLKEIIYNLLENAIKFTGEKGSINIEVSLIEDMLRFSVRDNGIGIAQESIDKIFDPFIQIDGSISRKYGGTGMGLALVKKLIELHCGSIRIESEVGKGSDFIFEIPMNLKLEK